MNAAPPAADLLNVVVVVLALFALVVLLLIAAVFLTLFGPWMRAFLSGTPVSIVQLIGMRLRGVPARLVVDALISLVHRGHPYEPRLCYLLESTYLAQRGYIESSTQLADMVERQLPKTTPVG